MRLNCTRTKDMVGCLSHKMPTIPPFRVGSGLMERETETETETETDRQTDRDTERVHQFQLLGVVMSNDLQRQAHVDYVLLRML